MTGYACSHNITYFPLEDTRFKDPTLMILRGIEQNLGTALVACHDISDCATDLFNYFVKDTQPEALQAAKTRASVDAFNWAQASR